MNNGTFNVQELRRCLMFKSLPEQDLAKLAEAGSVRSFPKKSIIFAEGDEAKGFYVLLEGMVKIYRISPDSREQIIHIINPGDTFAEAAIFIGSSYPAFAETILDSRCFFFEKKRFIEILRDNPALALNVVISVSMMLKRLVELVDSVSLKSVDARLAKHLLEEAVRHGSRKGDVTVFVLPTTKTELAKKLGTVSETLSRTLRRFQDDDIITVDKRTIGVLDMEGLQEIAGGEQPF